MSRWVPIAAAVLVAAAAIWFAGSGAGRPDTLEERAQVVAAGLRCPVCQNLSVADSPSRLAGEMRGEIRARLADGETEDEVRAYFVERYGEWVLLEPTRRGLNLVPWLFPLVAVLVGVGVWAFVIRRRPPTGEEEPTEADRPRVAAELAGLEDVP
ncbi:MAG TPA: cytochrome c-type biogenesis protein CcmH [Actinomycetota bacterium]|jgi:cytochrome c-type biogenesis protein CcmH